VTLKRLTGFYYLFCAIFLGYLFWVVPRGWNPATITGAAAFLAVQLWFIYMFYTRRWR
jgi:hypothetical protein